MSALRSSLVVGLVAAAAFASARLTLHAQDGRNPGATPGPRGSASVLEALERPFTFAFDRPTPLAEVCRHLGRELNAPVVLDRAALDRQDVRPEETVQLELRGVRLKIGLKLLLDQLELTYRVVPEDNLLILTDAQGSDDPIQRVMAELEALHRDVHDVQDAVDDVLAVLDGEGEGPRMHKPTIIEELPDNAGGKAPEPVEGAPRTRPGA